MTTNKPLNLRQCGDDLTMKKKKIEYNSPVDALVAISKRLNTFENLKIG